MFRAYGSLPPSECTSPAVPTGSTDESTVFGPFDLPRWSMPTAAPALAGQHSENNGAAIGTRPTVRRAVSLFDRDYQRQLHGSLPSASGQQQEQLRSEYRQDNDQLRTGQTLASMLLTDERLFQPNDDPLEGYYSVSSATTSTCSGCDTAESVAASLLHRHSSIGSVFLDFG
uniref:Uncharacterized protein n=1 Tax=Anopheles farauti TaxID=69004 RepID=A0A182QP83_9DIPT